MSDVLMLVLVAIADLRGAPMDAELLAEKLESSRSTIERRLKPYLDNGRIAKERRGKSVVYLWSAEVGERDGAPPDMSVDMVRAVMAMVFDISND
jgi:DNA-binding transcriptional ArsR family regulator